MNWAAWIASGRGSPVRTFGASVIDILTILLLGVYLLVDGARVLHGGLSLVPSRHRVVMHDACVKGAHRMQHWVGGQGLLMLTHGGSALLTFRLLGLPYFFVVAVFAGVINVIPFPVRLLIGYELAGIVGMLVSVPTAVLIAELKSHLFT